MKHYYANTHTTTVMTGGLEKFARFDKISLIPFSHHIRSIYSHNLRVLRVCANLSYSSVTIFFGFDFVCLFAQEFTERIFTSTGPQYSNRTRIQRTKQKQLIVLYVFACVLIIVVSQAIILFHLSL